MAVVCLSLDALLVILLVAFDALSDIASLLYVLGILGVLGVLGLVGHFRGYRFEFYESLVIIMRRGREPVTIPYSQLWLGNLVQSSRNSVFKMGAKPAYSDPSQPGSGPSQTYSFFNAPLSKSNTQMIYGWLQSRVSEASGLSPPATAAPVFPSMTTSAAAISSQPGSPGPDYRRIALTLFGAAVLAGLLGPTYFWTAAGNFFLNFSLGMACILSAVFLALYARSLLRAKQIYAFYENLEPGSGPRRVRRYVRVMGLIFLVLWILVVVTIVGIGLSPS